MFTAARAVVPPRSIVALLTLYLGNDVVVYIGMYIFRGIDTTNSNTTIFQPRQDGRAGITCGIRERPSGAAMRERPRSPRRSGAPGRLKCKTIVIRRLIPRLPASYGSYIVASYNDVPHRQLVNAPLSIITTLFRRRLRASADDVGKRYCSFRVPPYV